MRKLLLIALLASGFAASAQVEAGSIMIGGSTGYTSTKEQTTTPGPSPGTTTTVTTTNNQFNFQVSAGYFLIDELALGLSASYQSNSSDNPKSLFGIGVFGRKYISLSDRFYLFGQGQINVLTGKNQADNNMSGWNFAVFPGLTFFPADNWGIDFSLNNIISYQSLTTKLPSGDNTNSEFQLGVGLVPTLGIFYYIH